VDAADSTQPAAATLSQRWQSRIRFVLGVAIVWAGLHFVADRLLLGRGLHRPVVLLVSDAGLARGLAAGVALAVAGVVGGFAAGGASPMRVLSAVGWALAIWAAGGGTIDDWLIRANVMPGKPTAAAYWPLLADYAFFAAVLPLIAVLAAVLQGRDATRGALHRLLPLTATPKQKLDGLLALLATSALAAGLIIILSGPKLSATHRGQAYFAVLVSFYAATLLARRLTSASHSAWYWPAPLIVGFVGVGLAAFQPSLGGAYAYTDVIPASALVRPLPLEMVGVGLLGVAWGLRSKLLGPPAPPPDDGPRD